MKYNEIGKTGMYVSNLSFGASSLGGVFHEADEAKAYRHKENCSFHVPDF